MIVIPIWLYGLTVSIFGILVLSLINESEHRQRLEMKLKLKKRMEKDLAKQRQDIAKQVSLPLTDGMLKVKPNEQWKPVNWD